MIDLVLERKRIGAIAADSQGEDFAIARAESRAVAAFGIAANSDAVRHHENLLVVRCQSGKNDRRSGGHDLERHCVRSIRTEIHQRIQRARGAARNRRVAAKDLARPAGIRIVARQPVFIHHRHDGARGRTDLDIELHIVEVVIAACNHVLEIGFKVARIGRAAFLVNCTRIEAPVGEQDRALARRQLNAVVERLPLSADKLEGDRVCVVEIWILRIAVRNQEEAEHSRARRHRAGSNYQRCVFAGRIPGPVGENRAADRIAAGVGKIIAQRIVIGGRLNNPGDLDGQSDARRDCIQQIGGVGALRQPGAADKANLVVERRAVIPEDEVLTDVDGVRRAVAVVICHGCRQRDEVGGGQTRGLVGIRGIAMNHRTLLIERHHAACINADDEDSETASGLAENLIARDRKDDGLARERIGQARRPGNGIERVGLASRTVGAVLRREQCAKVCRAVGREEGFIDGHRRNGAAGGHDRRVVVDVDRERTVGGVAVEIGGLIVESELQVVFGVVPRLPVQRRMVDGAQLRYRIGAGCRIREADLQNIDAVLLDDDAGRSRRTDRERVVRQSDNARLELDCAGARASVGAEVDVERAGRRRRAVGGRIEIVRTAKIAVGQAVFVEIDGRDACGRNVVFDRDQN